jgi:hypothetical protein
LPCAATEGTAPIDAASFTDGAEIRKKSGLQIEFGPVRERTMRILITVIAEAEELVGTLPQVA